MATFNIGSFTINTSQANAALKSFHATVQALNTQMTGMGASFNKFQNVFNRMGSNTSGAARSVQQFNNVQIEASRRADELYKNIYRVGSAARQAGQAVFAFASTLAILAVPVVKRGLEDATRVLVDYQ